MERELLQKVQATLEPLVGTDGFRASVSLDCDMTSGDQSEETFDPNRSVMVNAQRSEDGSAPVASNGVPGTASNLPRPTSRPGTGTGSLYRRTENTTFQTSRVVRRLKIPQGQIRRLSTSVLLDYTVRVQGGKRTLEAPAPERLRAIRELVGAAVGYREDRGDRITIEALPFEITKNEPAPVAQTPVAPRPQLPAWIPDWIRVPLEGNLTWLMGQSWLPIAVLTLIAGILFAVYAAIRGLVRRVIHFVAQRKAGKLKGQHVDITVGNAIGGPQAAGQLDTGSATENVSTVDALEKKLKNREEEQERLTVEALNALEVPKAELHKGEVLTRHIHELVKKDPVSIANLLRTWLADTGR
jgi:flagellar M-ring protein FliF